VLSGIRAAARVMALPNGADTLGRTWGFGFFTNPTQSVTNPKPLAPIYGRHSSFNVIG